MRQDRKGFIVKEELGELLNLQLQETLPQEKIDQFYSELFDTNGDDRIYFDECASRRLLTVGVKP